MGFNLKILNFDRKIKKIIFLNFDRKIKKIIFLNLIEK